MLFERKKDESKNVVDVSKKFIITSEGCGWIFKADKSSWGMMSKFDEAELMYANLYDSEEDAERDLHGDKALKTLSPACWRNFTPSLRIISVEDFRHMKEIYKVMDD
jgi:hypothetical protein